MPLDDPNEYFWWVDEEDNVLGKIIRAKAHDGSLKIHRSIGIAIVNSKNEILLQKRSMKKDLQAGKWGMSVGGHVTYGETYEEAAKKEMMEELGLDLPLEFVMKLVTKAPSDIEYNALFKAITDETPKKFDRDEIDEVRWIPVSKLKSFIKSNIITPGAKEELKVLKFI